MNTSIDGFLEAAKKGVVTVEFKKIGTDELRIMPCTLNPEVSENNVTLTVEQQTSSEHYAVWALDKKAWRSFRVNTMVKWYEGYPNDDSTANS